MLRLNLVNEAKLYVNELILSMDVPDKRTPYYKKHKKMFDRVKMIFDVLLEEMDLRNYKNMGPLLRTAIFIMEKGKNDISKTPLNVDIEDMARLCVFLKKQNEDLRSEFYSFYADGTIEDKNGLIVKYSLLANKGLYLKISFFTEPNTSIRVSSIEKALRCREIMFNVLNGDSSDLPVFDKRDPESFSIKAWLDGPARRLVKEY